MKNILLLMALITVGFASDLRMGGYLRNSSSVMIDGGKDELFTDIATVRLEGAWNWSNGGMEVHVDASKSLRPVIPFFEVYRENSLMMDLTYEFANSYLSALEPAFEGLLPSDSGTPTLTEDQIEMLKLFGEQLPYSSLFSSTSVNLDRAVIKLYLPKMDIFFGRQPVAWGTGYAFNPTDLWNIKNATDPTAPKVGINALRAEIPLGDLAGLSLVTSTGNDFKHSSGGFRLKWYLGGFDMSISGISMMNADREMFGLKRKIVAGADLAGEIGPVGVWYEVAVANRIYNGYENFDSLYTQIDLGLDYTFSNGLYLMGEYFFNSLGKESYTNYSINDMAAVAGGEAPGMGVHYIFGGLQQNFVGRVDVGVFGLVNVQEKAGMLMPEVKYTFNDHIELKLKGSIAAGSKRRSEYGSLRSSVQLEMTGYF